MVGMHGRDRCGAGTHGGDALRDSWRGCVCDVLCAGCGRSVRERARGGNAFAESPVAKEVTRSLRQGRILVARADHAVKGHVELGHCLVRCFRPRRGTSGVWKHGHAASPRLHLCLRPREGAQECRPGARVVST